MKTLVRVSAVAIAVLLLAGCGSSSKTTPPPTPTATATPAALVCNSSQLVIVRGQESAAMGARGVSGMAFRNASTTPCTLMGYPSVEMINASGKSIPTFITHVPALLGIPTPIKIVNMALGGLAKFDMLYEAKTGYGSAVCPTSTQVNFTPPGSVTPLVLPWKIQPYGGATIAALHCGEIKVSPLYAQ